MRLLARLCRKTRKVPISLGEMQPRLAQRDGYFVLLVACMLLPIAVGCGSETDRPGETSAAAAAGPSVGAVAVIDLDAVARRLGRDSQVAAAMKQRETSLNQQLQVVRASYLKQIGEKQQEFGGTPTAEQTQMVTAMQKQATVNFNGARSRAQNDLSQHRTALIAQFRDEVRPIAREVARQQGLSIIVTKNDGVVFDYDSGVDITDAVVQQMLARRPAVPKVQ